VKSLFEMSVRGLETAKSMSIDDLYFHRVATSVGTFLISEHTRPFLFGHPDLSCCVIYLWFLRHWLDSCVGREREREKKRERESKS